MGTLLKLIALITITFYIVVNCNTYDGSRVKIRKIHRLNIEDVGNSEDIGFSNNGVYILTAQSDRVELDLDRFKLIHCELDLAFTEFTPEVQLLANHQISFNNVNLNVGIYKKYGETRAQTRIWASSESGDVADQFKIIFFNTQDVKFNCDYSNFDCLSNYYIENVGNWQTYVYISGRQVWFTIYDGQSALTTFGFLSKYLIDKFHPSGFQLSLTGDHEDGGAGGEESVYECANLPTGSLMVVAPIQAKLPYTFDNQHATVYSTVEHAKEEMCDVDVLSHNNRHFNIQISSR